MPARAGEEPATAQARQHYQKAQKAYDLGRWDDAIAEYEAAYSFRSDPTFLFNMAQAYRRKGDAQRALDLFKNYLVKVPDSPQRADIEERIRSLKKQLEAEQVAKKPGEGAPSGELSAVAAPPPMAPVTTTPAPADGAATPTPFAQPAPAVIPAEPPMAPPVTVTAFAAPAPAPAQENRSLRITGMVVGGVGLAAVVGGAIMGLRAKGLADDITSDAKKQPVGTFDRSKYDSGKTAETLQWVGYGVGAAALIGGSVLYWLGLPKSAEPAATQTSITMLPYASANSVGGHLLVGF